MFKRLIPLMILILSVLWDTAILPVFYSGRFLLPISLVVVILCGIQFGRLSGMFYGLIGGLLVDISAGTLGMKLFPYISIGFLIGFLLDQQPEINRSMPRSDRIQFLAVRAIWIAVLLLLHEIVMLVYQYFHTAVFSWSYVRDLLLRAAMMTGLCLLLHSPFHHLCFAGAAQRGKRAYREVKRF